MKEEARQVVCPGCGQAVLPGDSVVHVDDDDPWKCLWHSECRRKALLVDDERLN